MNYKNSKPKPFKGCCWMCAKQDRRCHRTPTRQEKVAPRADEWDGHECQELLDAVTEREALEDSQ